MAQGQLISSPLSTLRQDGSEGRHSFAASHWMEGVRLLVGWYFAHSFMARTCMLCRWRVA